MCWLKERSDWKTTHFRVYCAFFYNIRQLRQIRPSLDLNSSIQLANALVSSELNYCNSLFYSLPDTYIKSFQNILNSLANCNLSFIERSDQISPILAKLHWIPIHKEIKFKIATITFKVLQNNPLTCLTYFNLKNPQDLFALLTSSFLIQRNSKQFLPLSLFLTLHLQFEILYLFTYVPLHLFIHSPLNSKTHLFPS